MEFGILDEVADHSTQQHRIPRYRDRLRFERAIVVSRAFLGRERGEVNVLTDVELLGRVEAADKQDLVHELVELGDIALELRFAFGICRSQLEPEPDPRQRRPELVRCVGEQHLVRVDQAFDPSGGLIEALSQACNLVAALDLDACGEIAGSERFDAALQALEASREPSHDRAGADSDHEGDGAEEGSERERAGALPARQPSNQPPTVGERYRNRGPGTPCASNRRCGRRELEAEAADPRRPAARW